jgi:hypothetical protein
LVDEPITGYTGGNELRKFTQKRAPRGGRCQRQWTSVHGCHGSAGRRARARLERGGLEQSSRRSVSTSVDLTGLTVAPSLATRVASAWARLAGLLAYTAAQLLHIGKTSPRALQELSGAPLLRHVLRYLRGRRSLPAPLHSKARQP